MYIWIAFYKGKGNAINSIVRKWTKSPYSHAELILNDKETWLSISPFLKSQISSRKNDSYNPDAWDFIKISITEEQHNTIKEFYDLTVGDGYDWVGMILSQFLPFKIKQKDRWYCSEWIAYALRISCVVDWQTMRIFDRCDLSP